MSDITELLRAAAPPPGDLDLERVHREGRRRQQRPRKIAGVLAVTVTVAAGAVIVATRDGSDTAPVIAPPATQSPDATTLAPTTVPPTTVTPTTTTAAVAAGEDRLSPASRLGYAGLGPIRLGMTFPDAERAGHVTIQTGVCSYVMNPESGSGLQPIQFQSGETHSGFSVWPAFPFTDPNTITQIDVNNPTILTISGIHVGSSYDDVLRTYPNAVETRYGLTDAILTITNPEGRVVVFYFNSDRRVLGMTLALSSAIIQGNNLC